MLVACWCSFHVFRVKRWAQKPASQRLAMAILVKAGEEPWRCSVEAACIGKQFRREDSLQQVPFLQIRCKACMDVFGRHVGVKVSVKCTRLALQFCTIQLGS